MKKENFVKGRLTWFYWLSYEEICPMALHSSVVPGCSSDKGIQPTNMVGLKEYLISCWSRLNTCGYAWTLQFGTHVQQL